MNEATKRIIDYLEEKGKMTGWDICRDLGVSKIDIDIAVHTDKAITEVHVPLCSFPCKWYVANNKQRSK